MYVYGSFYSSLLKMCIFNTTKAEKKIIFGKYSFSCFAINVVGANKQMDVFECHYLVYNDIICFMKNSAVWAALVKGRWK